MQKIRKNDQVVIITGKDKGRRGSVMQVLATGKVLVKGVNVVKKHQKPNPTLGVQGGVIEKEMPVDAATGSGDRVGFKLQEDGKKVRVIKSNGERVDA